MSQQIHLLFSSKAKHYIWSTQNIWPCGEEVDFWSVQLDSVLSVQLQSNWIQFKRPKACLLAAWPFTLLWSNIVRGIQKLFGRLYILTSKYLNLVFYLGTELVFRPGTSSCHISTCHPSLHGVSLGLTCWGLCNLHTLHCILKIVWTTGLCVRHGRCHHSMSMTQSNVRWMTTLRHFTVLMIHHTTN